MNHLPKSSPRSLSPTAAVLAAVLVSGIAATLGGCGSHDGHGPKGSGPASSTPTPQTKGGTQSPSSDAHSPQPIDVVVTPPHEYYDALFTAALSGLDQQHAGLGLTSATGQALWVNFEGASLTKGFAAGQSFILCNQTATIPAATDLSAADRDSIVQTVQQFYDAAGARLTVTDTKPTSGDFTTINVGGSYADLGCVGPGVAGVAPFDAGNADPNDIGFAFLDSHETAQEVAEIVAHEAGHTFGLQHVDTSADLMFPSLSPGTLSFSSGKIVGGTSVQDDPTVLQASLGKASAAPATPSPGAATAPSSGAAAAIPGLANLPGALTNLPGLGQIAGLGQLLPALSGGNVLDISKLLPLLQGLGPIGAAGGSLQGLDKILTLVGLAKAGAAGGGASAIPGLGNLAGLGGLSSIANLGNLGGLVGSLLNAKGGSSPLNLNQLLKQGGFANLPGAVQALQGGLGGGLNLGGAANLPAQLPNLASLLNLGGGANANPAALLKNLTGSAQVVNGNFGGANAQALLSLLKVAYSQQFTQLLGTLP